MGYVGMLCVSTRVYLGLVDVECVCVSGVLNKKTTRVLFGLVSHDRKRKRKKGCRARVRVRVLICFGS